MSRTLQIGLVEDDPTQAKIISTMIENSGMDCLHYGTELDFRRRMGPESIDLLLLDWNLPGVSGQTIPSYSQARLEYPKLAADIPNARIGSPPHPKAVIFS